MIWLVWNANEAEVGADRIDADSATEAAEEWARREGARDPANYGRHVREGLELRARWGDEVYDILVVAEAVVHYHAKRWLRVERGAHP